MISISSRWTEDQATFKSRINNTAEDPALRQSLPTNPRALGLVSSIDWLDCSAIERTNTISTQSRYGKYECPLNNSAFLNFRNSLYYNARGNHSENNKGHHICINLDFGSRSERAHYRTETDDKTWSLQ